jgi:hypothetical protein
MFMSYDGTAAENLFYPELAPETLMLMLEPNLGAADEATKDFGAAYLE